MAKKAAKTGSKTAKKRAAPPPGRPGGFTAMALHVTEPAGAATFAALKAEHATTPAFALDESRPENLDPESAAKRILAHALASDAVPSLTTPKVSGTDSDFKSLGVETVPLTGTTVVKFRQQVHGIPIYGSLISVELDDNNEMVSINSNLAAPDVRSFLAKISPADALAKVATAAGYGRDRPQIVPALNLFFDSKGKWRLAYIAENVHSRKKEQSGPLVYDFVIDALAGSLVAELPRTPSADAATDQALDELGTPQTFCIDVTGAQRVLRDPALNIETYDFGFRDPNLVVQNLPGTPVAPPWSSAAVSAHVNAAAVATYLRTVLKRNNIDNKGGRVISSVNCVVKTDENPPGSNVWLNAFWNGTQMIYGQAMFDDRLRSLASSLDIVAHELFHGVTAATARLIYQDEPGTLNESYSDIFGALISNAAQPDIAQWNWQIGDALSTGLQAFRDMSDPPLFDQPKLMKDYKKSPVTLAGDFGGVHVNSGIHNFAAFKIMTTRGADGFLFRPAELAAMFYVALTQQLSRMSTFSDSRRGVVIATRSLFRKLPQAEIDTRAAAVEAGFDAAGIK
ncbi:MAG: neutral peptidase [Hyphomicrobiales bacterium]